MQKQRLELDWIGKDEERRLEPRILIENAANSYGAKDSGNTLVRGDNLLALKALESDYSGKVKLCFIDPPYNTGSAFTQYDDGLEHSIWLSLISDRLKAIRRLLSEDGSLWISIDDNEAHYLKVVCDEIFGRKQFIASIVWQKTTSSRNDAEFFSISQDYILIYAKDRTKLKLNRLPRTAAAEAAYSNPDNDPRGPWREGDYKCAKSADERPNLFYSIKHPKTGEEVWPRRERVWAYGRDEHERHVRESLLWWGKTGNYSLPKLKRFRSQAPDDQIPHTLWLAEEVGQTRTARTESKDLFPGDPFGTPKPERLMRRIIELATNKGDLVLDSFAGSGTTGAVAHKLQRQWIMVELGEHCNTHIAPRMKKVVDGDGVGVSEELDWKGGGGFTFCELAPSLLQKDTRGNWIISPKYNAVMLAQAVCKHEGFKFWPDAKTYWKQGYSTEKDFIFVTTEFLTAEHLDKIAAQMKPDETLLICAKSYRATTARYPNITIKKIPQMLLGRCEFGRDDYSLNIKEQVQEEMDIE